jgi:uncharacterized protein YyaL (SSP411 family)
LRALATGAARAVALSLLVALAACDARPPSAGSAPVEAPARSVAVIRRDGNHLLGQPSPYLEQHAHNPVDWYPWGPEALDRARREHRLIFVSVGYATCHWCHVMEHETFEDDETARLLNDRFVAIKVDREERPDLDAVLVEAVMALGESAGWPLNVVLTPDLDPVLGGTYFPRVAQGGRPGLADVLREVDRRFHDDGPGLAGRGRELLAKIRAEALAKAKPGDLGEGVIRGAMASLAGARDPVEGGFGTRQKFPNTPLLLAELRWVERVPSAAEEHEHLALTLDHLRRGGVRDHLAGTFHRYATDRAWHVPHFEKTLYDNAQLAGLFLEASRVLSTPAFLDVGRAVLDDLVASWQRPDGGLVVGFDADDPGGEGAYYTFTPAELARALGAGDARIVGALFGVGPTGERALGGRSVLHRREEGSVARDLGVPRREVDEAWARALPKLVAARAARPPPQADDKELAAWNGLALTALADAGRTLGEPRYVAAAQRVGRFLVERCWDGATRTMRRGLRRGAPLGEGFLDDYALAALGLLRLHAADGDVAWLADASAITAALVDRFFDDDRATFFRTALRPGPAGASDAALPLRLPDVDDGVLPSGGAAAALLLVELGAISGDATLYDRGLRALRAAVPQVQRSPYSSGFFLVAMDHATGDAREVVIAGDPGDPRTRALALELAPTSDARVLPVLLPAEGPPAALAQAFPALAGKRALHERPTAFVCRRGACDAPVDSPAALREKLLQIR